jgi:hypothetical protein
MAASFNLTTFKMLKQRLELKYYMTAGSWVRGAKMLVGEKMSRVAVMGANAVACGEILDYALAAVSPACVVKFRE